MPFTEDDVKKIIEYLSEEMSREYIEEDIIQVRNEKKDVLLSDPVMGLRFFLWRAFAKAGGEQAGYGDIAVETLDNIVNEYGGLDKFLMEKDAPETFWNQFVKTTIEKYNINVNENDRPRLKKLIRLAQESREFDYNLFKRISSMVEEGNLLGAFILLRIGDKVTSFILRDMVVVLGIEGEIERKVPLEYQVFLQPIDRWVWRIAIHLIKEFETIEELISRQKEEDLINSLRWIVAYKIIEKCKKYGHSPLRFNQGAWKYGSSYIKCEDRIWKNLDEEERKKLIRKCLEGIVKEKPCQRSGAHCQQIVLLRDFESRFFK